MQAQCRRSAGVQVWLATTLNEVDVASALDLVLNLLHILWHRGMGACKFTSMVCILCDGSRVARQWIVAAPRQATVQYRVHSVSMSGRISHHLEYSLPTAWPLLGHGCTVCLATAAWLGVRHVCAPPICGIRSGHLTQCTYTRDPSARSPGRQAGPRLPCAPATRPCAVPSKKKIHSAVQILVPVSLGALQRSGGAEAKAAKYRHRTDH